MKHMQRLLDMAKDGTFKYAGRDNQPDQLLVSGKAGIHFNSSGMRGDMVKSAKFDWGEAFLPYDPEIIKSPLNSIIGGASLWTMTAPSRTPAEYKAVATFLQFIGKPDNDAYWHQHTGYVPVTFAGFELSQKQGFYDKNPGADLPVKQLDARHGDGQFEGAAAGAARRRSATSSTRRWRRRSRAARARSRRWTARSAAATRCCATSRSR